jgi:hypothetical protein
MPTQGRRKSIQGAETLENKIQAMSDLSRIAWATSGEVIR